MLSCQAHGNSGISRLSSGTVENTASVIQPSQAAARFPAVVDPLTQAAVAQVGAVYQAAAAAAYKAVAASGLMPSLSQNVPSLVPQPSQQQAGCMLQQFVLIAVVGLSLHYLTYSPFPCVV